ncbi:hypothetical protein ACIQOF_32285 [Streptomyces sp. NPDC091265]|uniref:hypothetical protein n=1 Tax=unclassified Streptomyces TaxID=2593676 RepID=UPI00344F0893
MTYRRVAVAALVGGVLVTVLLWWAGASAQALQLPGSSGVLGGRVATEFGRWLAPWSYDPPGPILFGGGVTGADGDRYLRLFHTSMQIRFGAVFAFFVPGAMLLVRRLPPVNGRTPALLLAVWAWGVVAGTLAVAVSAPWRIAAQGHASYRFLPQLASVTSSGRQILVVAALVAAAGTVLAARGGVKDMGALPREAVPVLAARLGATAGTAVVALSVVVLSYQSVAATIQTSFAGSGLLAEPGDLLRQWLLLGAWTGPSGVQLGDWLLYRASDVLLLVVVWWSLRWLSGLLTRVTFPAMAVGAVCATVLGLLAGQLLRVGTGGAGLSAGLLQLSAGLGEGVPAAVTCGLAAGIVAAATLRTAMRRTGGQGGPAGPDSPDAVQAAPAVQE